MLERVDPRWPSDNAEVEANRHHSAGTCSLAPKSIESRNAISAKVIAIHESTAWLKTHVVRIEGIWKNNVWSACN
jgi:hypothetical protein